MNLAAQIAMKSTALPIKAVKSTMKRCIICIGSQKQSRKQRKKAQKTASDSQTQIEKNLKSIITSHFSKRESKIEQITKNRQ